MLERGHAGPTAGRPPRRSPAAGGWLGGARTRSTSRSTTCACPARWATGWPTRSAPRGARRARCGSPTTRTSGRRTTGRGLFPPRRAPSRTCSRRSACRCKPIPGWRDLMHHKYVVRDGERGLDRLDELDAGLVDAPGERRRRARLARRRGGVRARLRGALGARHGRQQRRLRHRGRSDGIRAPVVLPRPRAGALAPDREADRRGAAARADRLAAADRRPDPGHARRGDRRGARRRRGRLRRHPGAPGVRASGRRTRRLGWKAPLLDRCLGGLPRASARRPTRPAPSTTTCTRSSRWPTTSVFVGSFNLSRSGEENAENVLEIADAALADRMADWIDGLRARYPAPIS